MKEKLIAHIILCIIRVEGIQSFGGDLRVSPGYIKVSYMLFSYGFV